MNWNEQEQIAAYSALAELVLPVFYVGFQKWFSIFENFKEIK